MSDVVNMRLDVARRILHASITYPNLACRRDIYHLSHMFVVLPISRIDQSVLAACIHQVLWHTQGWGSHYHDGRACHLRENVSHLMIAWDNLTCCVSSSNRQLLVLVSRYTMRLPNTFSTCLRTFVKTGKGAMRPERTLHVAVGSQV